MPGKGWSFTGKIHQKVCDKAQLRHVREHYAGDACLAADAGATPTQRPAPANTLVIDCDRICLVLSIKRRQ